MFNLKRSVPEKKQPFHQKLIIFNKNTKKIVYSNILRIDQKITNLKKIYKEKDNYKYIFTKCNY